MLMVVLLAASVFGYSSVPIGRMINAVQAYPPGTTTGQTLQNAYDYITSSDRDAAMGTLAELNPRTLVLTAGKYTSTSLILDTNYVNIVALGDVVITDTSGVVINCGSVIAKITGVKLDASSIANGLSNDENMTLSDVTIIDGTNEIVYRSTVGIATTIGATTSETTYNTFNSVGIVSTKTSGGGAATGSTGDENLWLYPMDMFEYHIIGGGQTILQPVIAVGGVNIGLDQGDDEGIEVSQGITAQSNRAFIVDTDAFYLKVKFSIQTIAGTDDCAVGFRLAEPYQAAVNSYNDYAILNSILGVLNIETDLNGSDAVTTDTTNADWADGESHTFGVFVDITGAVTYTIDGAAPTATAAFTFDTGDVIVPFMYHINDPSFSGAIIVQSWECGLQ